MHHEAGCSSPFLRSWPIRCTVSAMPTATPTVTFPAAGHHHPLTLDWYWNILLGDRKTCVNNLPKIVTWKSNSRGSNREPFESQVQRLTITGSGHLLYQEKNNIPEVMQGFFQFSLSFPDTSCWSHDCAVASKSQFRDTASNLLWHLTAICQPTSYYQSLHHNGYSRLPWQQFGGCNVLCYF